MHASRFFHLKAGLINYSKYAGDRWEKGEGGYQDLLTGI